MTAPAILAGKTVLLVEDDHLVALLLGTILANFGCNVIGPFDRLHGAMAAATTAAFDVAVLDVNLAGETVYPVAELLEDRDIPFLLLSGYGPDVIPPGHPDWSACAKPFKRQDLATALSDRLATHEAANRRRDPARWGQPAMVPLPGG